MMPGMNPRMMKQAMKRLGIQQQEIDASVVVITCADKEIIIKNPQVSKVNMMGQNTYQIVGEEEVRNLETAPEISDEDIETVMEQAGCTREEAEHAVKEHQGDLAKAIMSLKEK
ncbi:MAG: nascent polypeptide-associated complex protein [Nanoarchaeota archaeon]